MNDPDGSIDRNSQQPPRTTAPEGGVSRRAAFGAVAAGTLAFAALRLKPRSTAAVPRGRLVLRYWEKWTGPEGDAVQRVVDRFNASQSRLWVVRVPIADITSKTMVAIAGGDPPDIVGLFSYSVPQFAQANAAIPLDEFTSRSTGLDPEAYAPAVRTLLSFNGRQWAGVNTCYTLALYYNTSMFREVGLDPDSPPRTIDDLDEASSRFVHRDEHGELDRVGFLQNLPGWWPYFWPVMFDGGLYDHTTGRATIANEPCTAAYSWARRCAARVGAADTARFANEFGRSYHSPLDPFFCGRAAMIVQGPWIANFIHRFAPSLRYACATVPIDPSLDDHHVPRGLLEADVLIIPRGCPHPPEAFEFLCFMQRQDVQEELAAAHGKSSPLREMSPTFTQAHINPFVRVHDAIAKSPRVRTLPQTTAWQAYSDLTISAFDEIWSGADTRSVLTRVQSRAQQLIDRAAVLHRARLGAPL